MDWEWRRPSHTAVPYDFSIRQILVWQIQGLLCMQFVTSLGQNANTNLQI
ncbi:MAG: hypothetical protein ACE5FD_04230 [Anaerolineae bacterium]